MDQATRQGSQALENAGAGEADEAQLRRDIAQTREELGDTVAALVEKTDVKTRAKEKVQDVKQTALRKKSELAGKAQSTGPDGAGAQAERLTTVVRENPVPAYVAGALAVGYLLGRRGRRR
jgi:uncharacterized protein DUF3618